MTTNVWRAAASRSQDTTEKDIEAAFDVLFLCHYAEIFRHAYRIVGSSDEAGDVAQETFLRLHQTQRLWASVLRTNNEPISDRELRSDGKHNVRAWLFRVATNLSFNLLRSRARRERRQADAMRLGAAAEESASDPLAAALKEDERATVRRILADLPERQAKLLLLRHAGLSYRELASAVDVAPGSIGTLLARASAAFERAFRMLFPDQGGRDEM